MNEKLTNIYIKDKNFYLNILKDDPNNYEAKLKLGLIDVKENNFSKAKIKFRDLLKIDFKKYEGYLNLANIYSLEGNVNKANEILKDYLNKVEDNIDIINTIGINFLNTKQYNELEKHTNQYIDKYHSYILYFLKGYLLTKINKISDSEEFFKKSIDLNPNFWNGYEYLLKQYEKQSRLKDFKNLIIKSKKIFKSNIRLFYYESLSFFRTKEFKLSLNILIDKKLKKEFIYNQNEHDLAEYYHLLSRVYEKLGIYNESYAFAIKRNETTLNFTENKKFKKELILDTMTVYKNFFNKKNKLKLLDNPAGIEHSNLTFLIGFPRSGTTLLDTILRSHSQTQVLEEKPYLLDIRHDFFKNHELSDILQINEVQKIKMQKKYFDSFDYKSDKLVIDKYPLNLIELGFIKILFPNSRIILAIRHPLDCIISCVLTSFKMNDGMVNFENIHTTSFFYNECFELLHKYIYFHEIQYHLVKYENIIKNFKDEISQLIKFLNLSFEENIYNFQDTAKQREKINTPSYDQVVQPIYSSSVNRYKNFKEINNITIDIDHWITQYSYKRN